MVPVWSRYGPGMVPGYGPSYGSPSPTAILTQSSTMLGRKKWMSPEQRAAYERTWTGWYKRNMKSNSLVFVGIPFFSIMIAGTYFMTQFASLRYEQHDAKTTEFDEKAQLDLSGRRRPIDINQEFYRLQQLDTDNWEQKRVKRLAGESENRW